MGKFAKMFVAVPGCSHFFGEKGITVLPVVVSGGGGGGGGDLDGSTTDGWMDLATK